MKMLKTMALPCLPVIAALAPLCARPALAANPKLTLAVMCKSYPNKKPTGVTSTFKASDLKIHCVFRLAPVTQGTARSVWTAVRAEGLAPNSKIYDVTTKPMPLNGGHFSISNSQPWPRGSYRVDIYVNNQKLRSLSYSVK